MAAGAETRGERARTSWRAAAILSLIAALAAACSSKDDKGTQGTGSGGAVPAGSAGAGGSGGATAGSGGAAGAGGSLGGTGGGAVVTVQPRVLVIDPATSRFLTLDVDGQPVRDLAPHLDFGGGFGARAIFVDGLATGWDGPTPSGILSPGARGLEGPRAPTVILIRAVEAASGDVVQVKALEPSGAVVTTQTLSGAWNAFEMSPKRGYLNAQFTDNTTHTDVIFRVSDSRIVWTGSAGIGGFARDDRHFVFYPGGTAEPPHVIDLGTGGEIASTSALIPSPAITSFQLLAVLDERAVITTSWQSFGMLLWTVDWQGKVTPFKSDMPMQVSETLRGFNPAGTKALWSRHNTNTGADLGSFEIDLATNASMAWTGPDFSCFGRPGDVAFKLTANAVQSCACGDGTCRDIAPLPAAPDARWTPRLLVSADRRIVVVTHEWLSAQAPPSYPEILCLRASGEVIARLPWGLAELDDTGRLLLRRPMFTPPMPAQLGIVNLSAGSVSWVDRAPGAAIVYE